MRRHNPSHDVQAAKTPAGMLAAVGYMLTTALVLGAIILGSLAPFHFHPEQAWRAQRIGHLGFPNSDAKDVILNLSAYVVVGFVLAWGVSRRRPRFPRFAALFHATAGGVALSLLMELTQTMLPGRCASWIDVQMNAAGAALGAFGWIWVTRPQVLSGGQFYRNAVGASVGRVAASVVGRDTGRGWEVVSRALTYGVILVAVAPFDFVGTVGAFGRALQRAELPPSAAIWGGRLLPDGPIPLAHSAWATGDTVLALGFLLMGAVCVRSILLQGATVREAAAIAVGRGALIAVLAETLQLFSSYHAFDLTDLGRNLAAVALGVAAATAMLLPRRSRQALAGR